MKIDIDDEDLALLKRCVAQLMETVDGHAAALDDLRESIDGLRGTLASRPPDGA